MVEGVLVFDARVGCMATKGCDGVSNIWVCTQHQTHEGPKGMLKVFSIHLRQREMDEMMVGERGGADGANVSLIKVLQYLL